MKSYLRGTRDYLTRRLEALESERAFALSLARSCRIALIEKCWVEGPATHREGVKFYQGKLVAIRCDLARVRAELRGLQA